MKLAEWKENVKHLLIEQEGAIAIVKANRPQALNALNGEMLEELCQTLEYAAQDESIRGLILTGAGEKAFIAGADIAEFVPLDAITGREFAAFGQEKICAVIESMAKPVIAAVNGFALGGGNEIAMACDIRIAAENATFGHPEVGLGILPLYAGTKRMIRLVGFGRAKELILTSRHVKAEEALRIGLVNQVVPQAELLPAAKKMMESILEKAPVSIRMAKLAINRAADLTLEDAAELECDLAGILFATADQKEGAAAFLEKRKANYQNR